MILGIEIAMLIAGILAFAQGKVTITKTLKAEGIPARMAGLVMMLPLPLAFAFGFFKAMTMGPSFATNKETYAQLTLFEGALVLCCLTTAILIVHLCPHIPAEQDSPSRSHGIKTKPSISKRNYAAGMAGVVLGAVIAIFAGIMIVVEGPVYFLVGLIGFCWGLLLFFVGLYYLANANRETNRARDEGEVESNWEVNSLFERAMACEQNGQIDEAIALLEQVVANATDLAYAKMVRSHIRRLESEEVVELLEVAPDDELETRTAAQVQESVQVRADRPPPIQSSFGSTHPARTLELPASAVHAARSPVIWIVGGIVAFSLVLIIGGAAVVWLLWPSATKAPSTVVAVNDRKANDATPVASNPTPPQVVANPAAPQVPLTPVPMPPQAPIVEPDRKPEPPSKSKVDEPKPDPMPIAHREISLPNATGDIRSVAYSRDGKLLAVGTQAAQAFWYDADSLKLLASTPSRKVASGFRRNACAICPNAEKVAFFQPGGSLSFYERSNPDDEAVVQPTKQDTIALRQVAFSPDGKYLCTTHSDRVSRIWIVDERKSLRELPGHKSIVTSTVFAPDDSLLACAGQGEVLLWDARTYQLLTRLKVPEQGVFFDLAVSPDCKWLAGSAPRKIYIWFLERHGDGRISVAEPRQIPVSRLVRSIVFSPDSNFLLSAAEDGVIRIWNTQTLKQHSELKSGEPDSAVSLAIRASDRQLAVGHRNRVLFYDLRAVKLE